MVAHPLEAVERAAEDAAVQSLRGQRHPSSSVTTQGEPGPRTMPQATERFADEAVVAPSGNLDKGFVTWFEHLTFARHALDAASDDAERLGALLLVRTFGENVVVNLPPVVEAQGAEALENGIDPLQAVGWVDPYGQELYGEIQRVQSEIDELAAQLSPAAVEAVRGEADAEYQAVLELVAQAGPVTLAADGSSVVPEPPDRAQPRRHQPPADPVSERAHRALCEAWRSARPDPSCELDPSGRAPRLRDVIVDTVTDDALGNIVEQLGRGDGGELTARADQRPKVHSAYSSAGLVVNAFGPWLTEPGALQQCPTGLRGKAPNLDLIAYRDGGVVAAESKCTEYLNPTRAGFSAAYDRLAPAMDDHWRTLFDQLKAEPVAYSCVDAAQLVKHYLGLRHTFPGQAVTLLYLFWEPTNAPELPAFAQHRAELVAVQRVLDGADIPLVVSSYAGLWREWQQASTASAWLQAHLIRLHQRYTVAI